MGLKKWYQSKTVWVNAIAIIALLSEIVTGENVVDTETEVVIISIVNLVLRLITKEGLTT